ncbi:MAG: DUF1156 domain-containing protein [Phormidium sp. BM_Day4_Bin.17]|nr:DUF1156 domain-containing protein [Phormidium sp. BM_Day4_Bin.17]UCJ11611.1 MAG: DUF1156 domain-containing protein [Phormidium sp. PBR-2020]
MRPKLFIEKIFPVKLLNQQVNYEHGGNPFKGLHRWYSRKPLSFSRASILASLLPESVTLEEFEWLLGLDWRQFRGQRDAVRLYKTPPTADRIEKVHDYCEETWGHRQASLMDAFAGGGSIPFEGVRYGLEVFASDLNPVAVVTMKAAMEFPLKFGPELQEEIDTWVQWVGDEAQRRLAEFFPSPPGETVQNYLWAHTVVCPSCGSTVPLSPNWWLYKRPEKRNLHKWCAVKPIPNPQEKRVDFELIRGKKGKGSTIQTPEGDFDPNDFATISRGTGKCPNCDSVIDDEIIKSQAQSKGLGHQLYAIAYKKGKGSLQFRIPNSVDFNRCLVSDAELEQNRSHLFPNEQVLVGAKTDELLRYGINLWSDLFNPRQLLTLVAYVEIINEAKLKIQEEYGFDKAEAIITYLTMVLDRCADSSCRLAHWDSSRASSKAASAQHSLNLMWNYPATSGAGELWFGCARAITSDYLRLCNLIAVTLKVWEDDRQESRKTDITSDSADNLFHIPDNSLDAIVTDPPYYSTIQYAELSDFFYVWQKRILGDIFPDLYLSELTDKDREAVANPSRFRNMGGRPEDLAAQDYEAKMSMAFSEHYRVLRDDGVMTVQFNHKDSGAWDVLTASLIDAGFEITASWAVSTENPQNLHQAKKNSVSSTVLLVCRKRDPNAPQGWWDDLRLEVQQTLTAKTLRRGEGDSPESGIPATEDQVVKAEERLSRLEWLEEYGITGIDLYLSAFGPALNVFSRYYPILDSAGERVRPELAFEEARRAVADYRLEKLLHGKDTSGIDALTQWYLLAWDAFAAREFPFDEARQLALAIGGFNVTDLAKKYKLLNSASGSCKFLEPRQRLKKGAFSPNPEELNQSQMVDGLHGAIALYDEENRLGPVRNFLQNTNLITNPQFLKTWEIAMQVLPDKTPEFQTLQTLWLSMEEIKEKVVYEQLELGNPNSDEDSGSEQLRLDLPD